MWDSSCSGHLDSGEDYDAAAVRELAEEIGVDVAQPGAAKPERWFRIEACEETGWEFVWVYRLRHEGPFVLHPDEIETGAWMAPAEVTRAIATRPGDYCPSFKRLWPMAVEQL